MAFDHFLITRFNLRNKDWSNDKNNQTVLNEEWLRYRYEIFEKFCFNSIKNQTTDNFIWLVYFDKNTPEKYREINRRLQQEFETFNPIYINSNQAFIFGLLSDIEKFRECSSASYLITTRIDNDDAFHYRTIETIQNCFNNQTKIIVNLSQIYCLDLNSNETTKYHFLSNPFLSLIEVNSIDLNRNHIFSRDHNHWRKDTKMISIEDDNVFCLQIIHERNVLNTLQGKYVIINDIQRNFNIDYSFKYHFLYVFKMILFNNYKSVKKDLQDFRNKLKKKLNYGK